MSSPSYKIDALGRREALALSSATTQRIFASLGLPEPSRRKAVSVSNLDLSAEIFVVLAASGGSAPSVSSTDNDAIVPPRSGRQFQIGPGIDLWIRSSSASTVAYTAVELI